MEKIDACGIPSSLQELDLNINKGERERSTKIASVTSLQSFSRPKPPSLVSLCLGVVGRHLEDIIDDLPEIAQSLPSNIKMAIAAISRRRKLLNDDVILALSESSWEILDVSGSDISDAGISRLVKMCKSVRAMDISRCSKLTPTGVSDLLENCNSLEVLRWGGCTASEETARRCVRILKPDIRDVAGESWEDLDTKEIAGVAESLRWLVWAKIDKYSLESLSIECPRIKVNPRPSPFGYRRVEVPREALSDAVLDDPVVEDIDPNTWADSGFTARPRVSSTTASSELPVAEKFRLAFLERDNRLAPKRAKNARQHQRRAERDMVRMSSRAKSMALASQVSKSLYR